VETLFLIDASEDKKVFSLFSSQNRREEGSVPLMSSYAMQHVWLMGSSSISLFTRFEWVECHE